MRTGGLNVQTSRAHEGSTMFKGMEGLVDGKTHPESKTNKVSMTPSETTQRDSFSIKSESTSQWVFICITFKEKVLTLKQPIYCLWYLCMYTYNCYKVHSLHKTLMVTISPERKKPASLGSRPGSILAL